MAGRRSTIRLKLLLLSSVLLLVIFSGMTVYLVRNNTATLRHNLQGEAKAFAALATPPIADAYNTYGDSGTALVSQSMRNYLELSANVTNATVVDFNGKALYTYDNKQHAQVTAAQASSFTPLYLSSNGALHYVVYPYFSISGAHPFSIVYTISNDQVNQAVHSEVMSLVVFGLSSLALTSVLTYVLINRVIVRPIREVSRQAKIISDGNLEQQIVIRGNDEIADLGSAVNTMADSLKASIAKLQEVDKVKSEFMAITSHNLRTPLTIINSYLESIELFDTMDKLKNAMGRIGDSVKRLDGFAEDVLTISRFELGDHAPAHELIPITELINRIADETKPTALLRDIQFVADIQSTAQVSVSRPHIRSAIWNIIDNAVKFTPKGGTITLRVTDSDGRVHITVSDTGIGISPAEIPKLFTKFHRATSTITYDYEGTGIGLYASKLIVEEHGGSIDVHSEEHKGSTFTINLPVASAPEVVHTQSS